MRRAWAIRKARGICLEIGCSNGLLTYRLVRVRRRVVAGDIDLIKVQAARNLVQDQGGGGAVFLQFDAKRLPFIDKSFDTVLLIDVLEHIEDPVSILEQAARIASRVVLLSVPNYDFLTVLYPNMLPEHFKERSHVNRTNPEMLLRWFSEAGLRQHVMIGSYLPMPLPFIWLSYVAEFIFQSLGVAPRCFHFQILCEVWP